MIQALNIPYSSKTDEIMSRYRPIAPKPETPNNSTTISTTNAATNPGFDAPLVPEKFRQSPYLRNMWSHLQARPTRTRKRGRTASITSTALLRKQHQQQQQQQQQQPNLGRVGGAAFLGLPSSARNLSIQAFGVYSDHQHGPAQITNKNKNITVTHNNGYCNNVVELPLFGNSKAIDLNIVVVDPMETPTTVVLEEKDLLLQLQVPAAATGRRGERTTPPSVISPRPVRPVGSSISIIGTINEDSAAQVVVKAPEEVEAVTEAQGLPAMISDRSNKVRMVNSAYKELVGQPECSWLNSMCSGGGRISGEVMLQLTESGLPSSSNGFSCWVRIEWKSEGKKNSVNAFCEVVKLACLSKDYLFSWRFHTREVSPSGSKV